MGEVRQKKNILDTGALIFPVEYSIFISSCGKQNMDQGQIV